MSKAEALINARRLVQAAVNAAARVGIDPSDVVAPHCAEASSTQDNGDGVGSENLNWCGVPVIIDNDTNDLFEMPKPDDDPEQKPAFLVTQSTANLVGQDFQRYKPSLERMAEDWQDDKNLVPEKNGDNERAG